MYFHPNPKLLKAYAKSYKPTPLRLEVQARIMREAKQSKAEFLKLQGNLFQDKT